MSKIAAADANAMDKLFAYELKKAGVKIAGEGDIQAFKDRQEYLTSVEEALKADNTEAWDPNDPTLD